MRLHKQLFTAANFQANDPGPLGQANRTFEILACDVIYYMDKLPTLPRV